MLLHFEGLEHYSILGTHHDEDQMNGVPIRLETASTETGHWWHWVAGVEQLLALDI